MIRLTARTALIGILLLTVCVYAPTIRNGFVNLDDPILVTENPHVQTASLASIRYVFTHFDPELYIPVTFLSYQLETWTLGKAAWHFHALSLLLHLIAVVLVYGIVRRYARSTIIASITALLFAVHPINAEAVLWVSARKDILSSVFFLASLLCYLRQADHSSRRWYWCSLAMFALALLSKVTPISLPLLLLLLEGRPKMLKQTLMRIGPFLLIAGVIGTVAILGKTVVEQTLHLTDLILMALRSTFFYLSLIVKPDGLSAVHSMNPSEVTSPLLPLSIIVITVLSTLFIRLRKSMPLLLTGWIFFLVTLAPTFLHYTRGNELFMLGSERYMYLPSVGIFLIVATLIAVLFERPWITKPTRIILTILLSLIVLVLSYLTVLRTFVFHDSLIFNLDTLQKNPEDGRTWYNLGIAWESAKMPERAEEAYRKALEAKPDLANAAISLGVLLSREGRIEESIEMFREAIRVRPDYFKGYFSLGVAEQNRKNYDAAIVAYKKTIELFPDFPEVHKNLATVYGQKRMFVEAIAEYEILAELDPSFRELLTTMKASQQK